MISPTERFIRIFEKIVEEVNRRTDDPSSHAFQIETAGKKDGAVRKNLPLLKYVRDVRNALQHPKHRSEGHAVRITEEFQKEVEELLNYLEKPPAASSVGVSLKDMKTAGLDEPLGGLADEMKNKGFSHVPIIDKNGVVIGVFNEAAVFHYLWTEAEMIVGRNMTISDILSHCRLDADHTETFEFVAPRTPIDDLVEMFGALKTPTTRVGAAFVTASGKSTEEIQRLITPWDVLEGLSN